MYSALSLRPMLLITFLLLCSTHLITAKQPIQFCKVEKALGINSCMAIFTLHNQTSAATDFYITLQTHRRRSSAHGWTAFAIGPAMKGALMFITYGDPAAGPLTTSIRTATGHHMPTPFLEASTDGDAVPDIRIVDATMEPYVDELNTGNADNITHTDRKHIICYGCDAWGGVTIDPLSTGQPFIWASSRRQDFGGDFADDVHLDMHQMGSVGFWWADLSESTQFSPTFGKVSPGYDYFKTTQIRPVGEPVTNPYAPTTDKTDDAVKDPPTVPGSGQEGDPVPVPGDAPPPTDSPQQRPKTWPGASIPISMLHLHGSLMSLSFLVLFPAGTLFIRSGHARAFNYHWTTQALASILVGIGAVIGVVLSYSISAVHQFLGIAIVGALGLQVVLGWRGHVDKKKTKGMMRWVGVWHVWLGRGVLGAGWLNLLLGLVLRRYGWVAKGALVVAVGLEGLGMWFMLRRLKRANAATARGGGNTNAKEARRQAAMEDAEEYFQLVGDDEDDGWSDDGNGEGEEAALAKKEQARRLARIDAR